MTTTLPAPDVTPEDVESTTATLNRDGSVRRKPGPKPGTKRKPRTAPAPGLRAPVSPKKTTGTDYRPAVRGLLQLPQLGLAMAAKFAKTEEVRDALVLDGMTVGIHASNIAEALHTTAQNEERLAQVLDKLSTVGPYSLVVMAILTPTIQVLANHGIVPPNEQMGVLSREALIATAMQAAG